MSNSNSLLEGNLGPISLPNLLQLIAMEQKTAVLSVHRVELGQSAEMIFRHGQLISARVNSLEGNLAMYRILGWWNAGAFKLMAAEEHELPEPNITTRMDYLLLEGMRQMDASGQYRQLVPALTSAVSFTQHALNSFRWDSAEVPEWIPHVVRQLPKSFSMSQLHVHCDFDEARLAGLMKMLLATQAVRVHSSQDSYQEDGFTEVRAKSTRYEAFAQLLMEYVGYDQAYGMMDTAVYDMGFEDLEGASFVQLVDLADRLCMGLNQYIDRKQGNEAQRRLRARATSLI